MNDMDVTLGEVYRLITTFKDEHGAQLDAIEKQVRITNGRTTKLEAQVEQLMRPTTASGGVPVVQPEGESFTVKISPKMWMAIVSAFMGMSMFAPKLGEWIEKLVGGSK